MASRVSPQILNMPYRSLGKKFDNAGTALGTTKALAANLAPSGYPAGGKVTTGLTDPNIAMGIAGDDHIVSIIVSDAVDITLWVWSTIAGRWVLGGASTTTNTKTFAAYAVDSFNLVKGTLFYLQASAVVTTCYLGANEYAGNPDS